jgi:dimeric dUTPase (all-alpha-NTP-PPase superfamily)
VLKFLKKYIELGYLLGYDVEKIKASYDKKHAVNIERQKTNY